MGRGYELRLRFGGPVIPQPSRARLAPILHLRRRVRAVSLGGKPHCVPWTYPHAVPTGGRIRRTGPVLKGEQR